MTLEIFFNPLQRSNWPFSQVVFDEMKWFSDSSPLKVITFDQPSSQYGESNWIKRDYLLKIGFGYTFISKEITVGPNGLKWYLLKLNWISDSSPTAFVVINCSLSNIQSWENIGRLTKEMCSFEKWCLFWGKFTNFYAFFINFRG